MRSKPVSDSDTVSTGAHAISAGLAQRSASSHAEPLVDHGEAVHGAGGARGCRATGGPATR